MCGCILPYLKLFSDILMKSSQTKKIAKKMISVARLKSQAVRYFFNHNLNKFQMYFG